MICLVYCTFVVCANWLICGAQHSIADIAERGRADVILEPESEKYPGAQLNIIRQLNNKNHHQTKNYSCV